MYMGRPILIGVPLATDFRIDARLASTVSWWERDEKVEAYYSLTPFPTLGRDKIVAHAKYRIPNPTHILFLDSDILPRKNTLDRLLKADKDIVMGVYPISQNGFLRWSVSRDEKFLGVPLKELPRNIFKIHSGGFGVVLVRYEVFEKLQWPYWKNVFIPGDVEIGEDIYFCQKAIEAGYDIWCDPLVKCSHIRVTNLLNIVKNFKE